MKSSTIFSSLKRKVYWVFGLTSFVAVLLLSNSVLAQTLYAVDGAGDGDGGPPSTSSTLYILDATDGSVVQTIGAIGFDRVVAIDFDPTTGFLYGHSNDECGPNNGALIMIDLSTGAGTFIGCTNVLIPDMSFDSTGTLYAWVEHGGSPSSHNDDLYTINLGDGVATRVGESGESTFQTGLAFDSSDSLFMKIFSQLFDVNPTTGAASFLRNLSASPRNMLAFDDSDVLFTGTRSGGNTLFTLQTIDVGDGTVTDLGSNDIGRIAGLAFQPAPLLCGAAHQSGGGEGVPGPSTFYRINTISGTATPVGAIGFNGVGGIDVDPTSGIMYGIGHLSSEPFEPVLITIDPITGVGTLVGTMEANVRFDITFHSDGTLFGTGAFFERENCISLFTIDTGMGEATEVGATGTCAPGNALAWDTSDTLFLIDNPSIAGLNQIYSLDQATGVSTPIAVLDFGDPGERQPRINAMDITADSLAFSINAGSGGNGPNFVAVDALSGPQTVNGLDALAFCGGVIEEPVMDVDIDLKPGSNPNCVATTKKKGRTPVGIYGSAELDVQDVDVTTLSFGGAAPIKCKVKHLLSEVSTGVFEFDGFIDLVCHYSAPAVSWPSEGSDCGAVLLTGELLDGTSIEGADLMCHAGEETCEVGDPVPLP